MPTTKCPMCGGDTVYNEQKLGVKALKYTDYHAHCPNCRAAFSNSTDPMKRVVVWENFSSNLYPSDQQTIVRLKDIIANSMNVGNREKKEPSMCSENSEDALTWSVFNTLEKFDLLDKVYSYFSGASIQEGSRIYYWGYNDKYPDDEMIQEYKKALEEAGEPEWRGGYSEPDILLFNQKHGLINIEVKYTSPNDDKLRDHSNQRRIDRAQAMLNIGKNYVKKSQAGDWLWYELLRMWVPGCLVAERMKVPSFTLINLLPKSMLLKENMCVSEDMDKCVKQNDRLKFKQSSWEDFLQMIYGLQAIKEQAFGTYIKRKLRDFNVL